MPKSPFLLKVCGLCEEENLLAVAGLRPDFVGFIFHPASARYAGGRLRTTAVRALPANIRPVGVFVNESTASVLATAHSFGLHAVQLHGQETPAQCAELRAAGLLVIKAFSIGEELDQEKLRPYAGVCDYFLFDTQGRQPGGNGQVFDWELLRGYSLGVPYFLAGGLAPEHAEQLQRLRLPGLVGLDLNSRFETSPGLKSPELLQNFFAVLRPSL
ncbi:phosphoribosylanthranilate isomerase [Hymenobacter saemangeumensis]|uniref:N-(5'-phosphoribosyl)anthranilate isomerase n=1 Tax=Hymenobacter saemangeumensis TaxID=1084522 RepID=A0ABP8IC03_9BACT